MATVNLGKVKLKWRGTYAGGTAYTPDDVVYYVDGSVGSSYICVTASTGNAPSSGGSAHSSWNYLAKGQATSPTTTQGDVIVRGASADARLAIGTAGQALKVNSSANGLEYGTAGGVLGMNQTIYSTPSTLSLSNSGWTSAPSGTSVAYTAKATTSHFLLEAFMSLGTEHHDLMYTMNWWDSLKGLSDGNELFTLAAAQSNRERGTFACIPSGAGVSGEWDSYWFSGVHFSALYYPDSGQRSTSARTFQPVFRRNNYNFNMRFNSSYTDNAVGMTGISVIKVTEIDGGIVG